MNTASKAFWILFAIVVGVVLWLLIQPPPPVPENPKVSEYTFDKLQPGEPVSRVESLLGKGYELKWGEVMRTWNRSDLSEMQDIWTICEISDRSPWKRENEWQGWMFSYPGPKGDRIEVLVWDDWVIASEYELDDVPVWYKGPKPRGCRSVDLALGSKPPDWWCKENDPKWIRYSDLLTHFRSRVQPRPASPPPPDDVTSTTGQSPDNGKPTEPPPDGPGIESPQEPQEDEYSRFIKQYEQAKTPEEFGEVARAGLALMRRVMARGTVVGHRTKQAALDAARKSQNLELLRELTLFIIQLRATEDPFREP